jgi:hypothetical protein
MAEMTDYIKIESYLKDVPDSFLMKEIQQATGEYPPVLIVAEYNRRKRMRNAAEGQQIGEPKSIVEDIKQEAGLMSAPGAMQTLAARDINQMGPPPEEMRPMPQQMPQQVPQMMPQQMMPMGMAGGGLVAFERGGPIRAQAGLYTGNKTQEELDREAMMQSLQGFGVAAKDILTLPGRAFAGAAEYGITRPLRALGLNIPYLPKEFYGGDPSSMTPYFDQLRAQQQNNALYSQQTDPGDGQQSKTTAATTAVAKPESATKPPPAAGGLGAFKPGALPSAQPVVDAIQALRDQTKMPTEQALDEAGQARAKRYEEDLPFREKEILERRITNRAEQIAKDKDMSFNDALIAAGAAILKSPGTPGSLAWMGEGLSAFGTTMKEGRKDIRKSQELMELSELELAKAESARDAGKFNQYEAGRDKALDLANKSREFAATNAALAVNQYTAQLGAAKLPYELAEMQSKDALQRATANLYDKGGAGSLTAAAKAAGEGIDIGRLTTAKTLAEKDLKDRGIKNPTPAQIMEQAAFYYPAIKTIPVPQPVIRGAEAPATLPGT